MVTPQVDTTISIGSAKALFTFLVATEQSCSKNFICSCTQCLLFFPYRKLFLEGNGRPALVRVTQSCTWFKNRSAVFSGITPVVRPAIIVHFSQMSGGSQCSYVWCTHLKALYSTMHIKYWPFYRRQNIYFPYL